jgi:acyl-CoA thioester hydrolase
MSSIARDCDTFGTPSKYLFAEYHLPEPSLIEYARNPILPFRYGEIIESAMSIEHQLEIRVRYNETDGQGRVHHAQYLNFFERGRVELLRSLGHNYRDVEESGLMLVVTEMNVRYLGAAVFDDLLTLTTRVVKAKGVRIEHSYEIVRPQEPQVVKIVTASSVIACIDRQGNVRRLPDYLRNT